MSYATGRIATGRRGDGRGRTYELTYRYETWVQYQTRRPRPRVDLTSLADRLNSEETAPGRWVAQPASALTPVLRLDGGTESGIAPAALRAPPSSTVDGPSTTYVLAVDGPSTT
jgi:hypothetical protein